MRKLTLRQRITVGQGSDQDTGIVAEIVGNLVTVQWESGVVTTQPMEALLSESWVRYYLAPASWNEDRYRYVVTEGEIRQMFDTFKSQGDPDWDTWRDARDECDELDADTPETAKFAALELAGGSLNPADMPTCEEFVKFHHGKKFVDVHAAADCLKWGVVFPRVDIEGRIIGSVGGKKLSSCIEMDLYVNSDGELYLDDEDGDGTRLGSMVAARLTD